MHPYNFLDVLFLKKVIKIFILLVIIGMLALCSIFITGPDPVSFLKLAFSGNARNATEIISKWTEMHKISIAFFSGFDFLWGTLWTNLLAMLFIYIKKIKGMQEKNKLDIFAYLCWVLWALDIPENLSYYFMVLLNPFDPMPIFFGVIMTIRWIFGIALLCYSITLYSRKTAPNRV